MVIHEPALWLFHRLSSMRRGFPASFDSLDDHFGQVGYLLQHFRICFSICNHLDIEVLSFGSPPPSIPARLLPLLEPTLWNETPHFHQETGGSAASKR